MRFDIGFRRLAAGAAFVLAGAAFAQAPATPSTTTPAGTAAPAATAPKAPAPAATGPGKGTPTQQQRYTAPRTGPGAAGVPSTAGGTSNAAGTRSTTAQGATKGNARAAKAEDQPATGGRGMPMVYSDLMTPEELTAHKAKVEQTKTYAECRAYFDAKNPEMEARAKAKNTTVKATPAEVCARARDRGRLTG